MYSRKLIVPLQEALSDTPVVMLNGPRQSGKSTLVQSLNQYHQANYITFDDSNYLTAARHDPQGFISRFYEPVILDEIQRVPALFLAIKHAVDQNRLPGRFLLTGSANVLLLPQVADSLAGRMEILTLWPLSIQERFNIQKSFIDLIFSDISKLKNPPLLERITLLNAICAGGYPEAIDRTERRRAAWFESYITTLLQRDVKEIAEIEGVHQLSVLLKLLGARTAGLLNFSELSRSTGIPQTTLKRYLVLLEMLFLISPLPAWHTNLSKRLVKSPKMMLNDTGLIAYLVGTNTERLMQDTFLLGPLLENFVVNELRKQSTWSDVSITLNHFRTQAGQEVDLVLEASDGTLVGIEIKASQTINAKDFNGLQLFSEVAPKKFHAGILLYTGENIIPFAKNLWAVPISLLFSSN